MTHTFTTKPGRPLTRSALAGLANLLAAIPEPGRDPFDLGFLGGLRVVESPDHPRYTLPAEVLPGVPWPPGFREDFNRWSVGFLGTVNLLPRGTAYVMGNRVAVMRPGDLVKLTNIV